jgi:hypothetical protein
MWAPRLRQWPCLSSLIIGKKKDENHTKDLYYKLELGLVRLAYSRSRNHSRSTCLYKLS